MAGKKAKRRKRDKFGHFVKKAKRSSAKRKHTVKRTRSSAKRKAGKRAPRKISKRLARGKSGRYQTRKRHAVRGHLKRKSKGSRKRVRVKRHYSYEDASALSNPRKKKRRSRAKRRHAVRGHLRKKKGSSKRTRVKRHYSYEEMSAVKSNPRRRKKRSRAREEVGEVMSNPRKRRRKTRRKARAHEALANPRKKRRKKAKRRASPKKRRAAARRRGRRATAIAPAIVRRGRKVSGGTVRVEIVQGGSRRKAKRSSKRRTASRKRRKSGRSKKRRAPRLGPASSRMPSTQQLQLFPSSGESYALENPMSRGELALAFATGGLGLVAGQMLDRFIATMANYATATTSTTTTAPIPDSIAAVSAPDWKRILAQVGLAAAPLLGSAYTPPQHGMVRAGLQGMALGVGAGLFGQVLTHWVLGKLFVDVNGAATTWGSRLLGPELTGDAYVASQTKLAGAPQQRGVGVPYGARPVMRGVGAQDARQYPNVPAPPAGMLPTNPRDQSADCLPCSSETAAAAMQTAFDTAMAAIQGGDCGSGLAGAQVRRNGGFAPTQPITLFPED